ncbi:MAG TPA: histidine phosphatase family protein [Candidatus Saccharimonadales bacterium]|jgi:broad specificity phosphatase PhoE
MKRLFYVRHGESEYNVSDRLAGRTEVPLTENGILQAQTAGKKAKESLPRIDLIISSPLSRAYHTAIHIAKAIGYPEENIEKNNLFIERTFGKAEGQYAKDFFKDKTFDDLDKVNGAETIHDLNLRAIKALEYIENLDQDNILVVSHGAFGTAFTRAVKRIPHDHPYEYVEVANGEIVELI